MLLVSSISDYKEEEELWHKRCGDDDPFYARSVKANHIVIVGGLCKPAASFFAWIVTLLTLLHLAGGNILTYKVFETEVW